MTRVETDVERRDGIALVRVVVENARTTRQTVRLRARVDGPVWPSGLAGEPAPDRQGDEWAVTLGPGRRRGVGFATPGELEEPPVVVESTARAPADGRARTDDRLADLEEWAPPRRVLVGGRDRGER